MSTVTFKGNPVTLVGDRIKVGEKAPDFTLVGNDLGEVKLSDYDDKKKIIVAVPSLDTGICSQETKRFNDEADKLDNVQIITVSMDLPFAQSRWCAAEGVKNLVTASDHKNAEFGTKYGALIEELRLLARSIFVLDTDNEVKYVEYCDEVSSHPDYDACLEAVKSL